jgi:hypothetical protein
MVQSSCYGGDSPLLNDYQANRGKFDSRQTISVDFVSKSVQLIIDHGHLLFVGNEPQTKTETGSG